MPKAIKPVVDTSVQLSAENDIVFDNHNVERDVRYVVDFLQAEGFRPEITKSGRVYFKFEGHHVYFQANPEDDQQFCLFIPNIWPLEPADRDLAIQTANHVCEKFVAVKAVYLESNEIWIAYEGYATNVSEFALILNRIVERLQYGARRFIDVFNELKKVRTFN